MAANWFGKKEKAAKGAAATSPPSVASKVTLPAGYEWYDGPFPASMFIDKDEPKRIWNGKFWAVVGKVSAIPTGHAAIGKPGSAYAGIVFVWNSDGTHGGRWARPVKK